MAVSPGQYRQLIAREMARYNPGGATAGDARDRAIRSANIAAGYGSSTAERRAPRGYVAPRSARRGAGGGGGGKKVDRTKTAAVGGPVPVPQPRPDMTGALSPGIAGSSGAFSGAVQPPSGIVPGSGGQWTAAVNNPAVPMNPALSLASLLRSVPPELAGGGGNQFLISRQPPGRAGSVGSLAGAAARVPQNAVGGAAHVYPGFHPASIFETSPPDPNESWWQAMLRG